jgi:hypothetical protein
MKEIIGIVTIILAVIGYGPYFSDIFKGKTKPHLFSWILYTITTVLVFIGQVQKGGGPGAWSTGVNAILIVLVTFLTIKKGAKDVTRSDKVMFAIALLSIIPWFLTHDPTISVLILTAINVSAAVLTMRKTIRDPGSESLILYAVNVLRHFLSIVALSNYNLATYIFPGASLVSNMIMVSIVLKPKSK